MYKAELYINDQRVDLFDGEPIAVVSSVQNIEDISRVFNDFSQSFSVPASKNNNIIFKHYYNATINNGFDARIRHTARLEINAVPFKSGTVRLEKCTVKNNRITDYRLTFFGLLIDLKDVIGDDYLSSLDLTGYDIAYSSDNVKTGITTGFSSEDYIFPLISTERRWVYDSNSSTTTYTDTLSNIAYNSSMAVHGMSWTSFRPALKVMRILEAIETRYGISFSRDFFGNTATEKLYLWLANADSEEALTNKTRVTDYDTVSVARPEGGSFDNSTGAWNPVSGYAETVKRVDVRVDSTDSVPYTVQLMNNATVLQEESGTGNIDFDYTNEAGLDEGASVYLRILSTANKTIDGVDFRPRFLTYDAPIIDETLVHANKGSFNITGSTAQVVDFIPKTKVMDFLTSLIRTFNLTIEPTSPTEFSVYTLDDWYASGNVYDISEYIDTSEVTVNRSKIYKEISFKYQEPQTILANQFNKANNVAYGDLETKLKDANGNPLDGEEFEIEVDFEQMVYEKLFDLDDDSPTNIVYGLCLDDGLATVTPEPHILYAKKVDVSGNPLAFVNDSSAMEEIDTYAFMPSHMDSTGGYSTTFGSEQDEHTNTIINNSLFANYYSDYITDSFSSKRRKYDFSGKFPIWLLNGLKLNDRLVINGERFIINQMTTEVTSGKVDLELLNDIYNLTGDSLDIDQEEPPNQTEAPPLVTLAKSFSVSNLGGNTLASGCALSPNTTRYFTSANSYPTLGDSVYTSSDLGTKFNGENKYYKISGGLVIRITSTGLVIDVYDCDGGAHL